MKTQQRNHLKHSLKALMASQKQQAAPQWLSFFLPYLDQHSMIGMYYPLSYEPDTLPLIQECWQKNCRVFLPRIQSSELTWSEYTRTSSIHKSSLGFYEPVSITHCSSDHLSLIVVPFLGVDEGLCRLGHGKGYYDKALKHYQGIKIGIGYRFQQIKFDTHLWDIKLDSVCLIDS